jgi:hypothetical protein
MESILQLQVLPGLQIVQDLRAWYLDQILTFKLLASESIVFTRNIRKTFNDFFWAIWSYSLSFIAGMYLESRMV